MNGDGFLAQLQARSNDLIELKSVKEGESGSVMIPRDVLLASSDPLAAAITHDTVEKKEGRIIFEDFGRKVKTMHLILNRKSLSSGSPAVQG